MSDPAPLSPRDYLQRIPNWVRVLDACAETLIIVLLIGGFFTYGYAEYDVPQSFAWLLCSIVGAWGLVGIGLGRWAMPGMEPVKRFAVLFGVFVAWTMFQAWVALPSGLVAALVPAWRESFEAFAAAGLAVPERVTLALRPFEARESANMVLGCFLFFIAVATLATRRASSARLAAVIGMVAVAEGIFGLWRYAVAGEPRAWGAVFNPNHHAVLTMMGLPLWVVWVNDLVRRVDPDGANALSGRNPLILLHGLAILAFVGALASLSRAALIGGGLVLLGWFVVEGWKRLRGEADLVREGRAPLVRLATIAGSGLVLVIILGWLLASAEVPTSISSRGLTTEQLTDRGRLQMWRGTLRATADAPLTGFGLRGTEPMLNRYTSLPTFKEPIWTHNDWIQVAAEVGLVGLLLMLPVAVWFGVGCWRELRTRHGVFASSKRAYWRAAAAGCLLVLVLSFVDFPLRIPLVTFTFLSVLALVIAPGALLVGTFRPRP